MLYVKKRKKKNLDDLRHFILNKIMTDLSENEKLSNQEKV